MADVKQCDKCKKIIETTVYQIHMYRQPEKYKMEDRIIIGLSELCKPCAMEILSLVNTK